MSDTQDFMDIIREMTKRGASCEMIARSLNRQGFVTPSRKVAWTVYSVHKWRNKDQPPKPRKRGKSSYYGY